MSNRKLKLAIIGCGSMARGHLDGYISIKEKEPDKLEFVAMCDPVAEQAQSFADKAAKAQKSAPGVYTDLEEMLKNEELDAADICSRHSDHHTNGIACLDAGAHVLIEKPFGVTIKAGKLIIQAAKRNGKIAATAENIRRGLSQRTAHWLFHENKLIGDPRMFFSQRVGWRGLEPGRWNWRSDHMLSGGGMVLNSGSHFCDTIRYLFGDVDTVYAAVKRLEDRKSKKDGQIFPNEQEDTWIANITFKSGVTGVWTVTWSAPGHSFENIVYYGTEGSIRDTDVYHGPRSNSTIILKDGTTRPMTEIQDEFLASLDDEKKNRLFPHGFMNSVTIECYDFLDAIQNHRQPEITGETGMKANAISESIYESAACGEAVKYDDVLSGKIDKYQRPINEYWGI